MKELLERVLKELPGYLPDLAALATQPKTTIARLLESAAGDLAKPLVFVAVSVALGFLLQLPQLGKEHDFPTLVAGMAVFKVLALIGFAGIIHGCFVVLGGVGSFNATFSAYLYAVSPLYLALVVGEIASLGVLRAHDPALAAAARINPAHLFEQESPGSTPSRPPRRRRRGAISRCASRCCWPRSCGSPSAGGAFARIHRTGAARSALAGLAAWIASFPFFMGLNYVLLGMFGAAVPALR